MIKITENHDREDSDDQYSPATYEIKVERILDNNILNTSKENIKLLPLGFYAHQLSECPEDATLERDLHYAYSAIDFFRLGLEIGTESGEVVVFDEFRKD